MRYQIRSIEDERSVTVEAVDWMMAMSQAIEHWNVEVSGWSCSARTNGDVHVQDPSSGRKWVVSPLRTEAQRRPLRRKAADAPAPAPPPPPSVGKSLGAPPPPNVKSVAPRAPAAPAPPPPAPSPAPVAQAADLDEDYLEPPIPGGVFWDDEDPFEVPEPRIIPPKRAPKAAPRRVPKVPPQPVVREVERPAPPPKLKLPSEGPQLPDYGPGGEWAPDVDEFDPDAPVAGPDEVAPTIARELPEELRAASPGPENLAERLFELGDEITASPTAFDACELTLEQAMGEIGCEAGSVLRGSLNDQALTFVACEGPAGAALVGRKLRFGRGIVGYCFDMSFTIVVNDVEQDERHLSAVDKETGFRTMNVLCTPIRTEAEHFGVLQLLNAEGGFEPWHVQVAESLAQSLAAALAAGLH